MCTGTNTAGIRYTHYNRANKMKNEFHALMNCSVNFNEIPKSIN